MFDNQISVEEFIENHLKAVTFLVSDVYNSVIRDDIRQDLLMYLVKLYDDFKKKKIVPKNTQSYVFISLRNYRTTLLKKDVYNFYLNVDLDLLDNLNLIHDKNFYSSDDNSDIILSYIEDYIKENMSTLNKSIIKLYFYENKTMTEIASEFNISQQAISKRIGKIREMIRNFYEKLEISKE